MRVFGNLVFVGSNVRSWFVPHTGDAREFSARLPCIFVLSLNHKRRLCPGAGNARIFVAGVFCVLNHKLPACPGAGNARQHFGERFLCKMESQTQYQPSENARIFFAGTFLGLEARIEISERDGTQEVSQKATTKERPRARMPDWI